MPRHPLRGAAAICGLGLTEVGRVYDRTTSDFAAEAVLLALADAGLEKRELDGLLVSGGISGGPDLSLAYVLGLPELALYTQMNAYGSTAAQLVQYAAFAVANGLARHVACVFADAPLARGESAGKVYAGMRRTARGIAGLPAAYGYGGPIPWYAMAAQRHMDLYGTTSEQLGAIAIATRAWAAGNPRAALREPLTPDAYRASPWVVEPLHVLDCCLVSNGGACVIVTSAERARDLARPPVYVHGMGQAHRFDLGRADLEIATRTPAVESGRAAFAMAECTPHDVTVCELYDCYTYTVLATFEDYGFCAKGEGGAFVSDGRLAPGGVLPTNTGGGELSSFYLWGMTPLSEGVIQGRGDGGARQVPDNRRILVSGNGGLFSHHATLVLSPEAA
ncbi:MAG TPA: thiolase family protein [Myxococcota bacterium]|nr:thiolase family protein [Myxococcota bacterium]